MWLSRRKVLVLIAVLLASAIGFHVLIRQSSAYADAVAAYSDQQAIKASNVRLCFPCAKRISYGNGIWHYTFTLVVDQDGASRKVLVRSQSVPGEDVHLVRFE